MSKTDYFFNGFIIGLLFGFAVAIFVWHSAITHRHAEPARTVQKP